MVFYLLYLHTQIDWRLYPRGDSSRLQHAKLKIIRFDDDFLRIVVTSSNAYLQWGTARDVIWVQDFPISSSSCGAGGGRRGSTNPHTRDEYGFRSTLINVCLDILRPGSRTEASSQIQSWLLNCLLQADLGQAKAHLIPSVSSQSGIEKDDNGILKLEKVR
jgi:Tyrosyl-DNA phosphodiesterase